MLHHVMGLDHLTLERLTIAPPLPPWDRGQIPSGSALVSPGIVARWRRFTREELVVCFFHEESENRRRGL